MLAVMPESTRDVLREVSLLFTTGVVSGRSLEKLRGFIDIGGIVYAGSHGFDIAGPSGFRKEVAAEYLPLMQGLRAQLETGLAVVSGASVEDNKFSLSVHYRNVALADVDEVERVVATISATAPWAKRCPGKKVHELRPR